MNFKSRRARVRFAGVAAIATTVTTLLLSTPAQAFNFTYNEDLVGDLGNTAGTATVLNHLNTNPALPLAGLPATGDPLEIEGEFSAGDTDDWAQFTLGEASSLLTIVMSSAHFPTTELGFEFFRGGTTLAERIASGTFLSNGNPPNPSAGAFLPGSFAAGEQFFIRTFFADANGSLLSRGPDYNFQVEAQPIPTPALLPGLLGMGIAALRKRKTALHLAETNKSVT